MQNCLQRHYKQFYLNARCVQGRCFTCTRRNWHSWLALLDLTNPWAAEMWFPFHPADLCPKTPHTHHWWVTVRLLFQARHVGEQFCCNHTGFCQWIREMCEQIHCLFVHQTALAHRPPHCWKVISLQRMYQLFQGKAILSVNCKKDSLIAKKKIPFPCCLFPPPLPLFFLSQMLLSSLVWILFLPTLLFNPKHGTAGDVSSFMVFETLFLQTLGSTALLLLLFLITLPWKMAFSAPPFYSLLTPAFLLPLHHPGNVRFYVLFMGPQRGLTWVIKSKISGCSLCTLHFAIMTFPNSSSLSTDREAPVCGLGMIWETSCSLACW